MRRFILLLGVPASLVALAAIIRMSPDFSATGDGASLSLHTIAAAEGRVLVGPYSQYGFNHPGPMLFYVLAPLYYLTDFHEMSHRVMALTLNAACILGIVAIARRYGDPLLAALTAFAILLIEWRAGGDLAFSPWNPHVTLLPLALLLFVGAAIASGATSLLPLAVVVASFVAQSHAGFVPLTVMLTTLPVIAARIERHNVSRRAILLATAFGVILWLPPLMQEISGEPGNISRMVQFTFADVSGPVSRPSYLRMFSKHLLLPFDPDMRLPLGWKAEVTRSSGSVLLAALLLIAGTAAAAHGRRRGRNFQAALCAICVVLSITGLALLHGLQREASDHHVFWLCIPGVFTLVGVCSALSRAEGMRTRLRAASMVAASLIIALFLGSSILELVLWQRAAAADVTTRALYEGLNGHLQAHGLRAPLLEDTPATWDQAAGIVLQAMKDGKQIAVTGHLLRVVGKEFAPTGAEDGRFVLFDVRADEAMLYDTSRAQVLRTDRFVIASIEDPGR